MLCFPIFKNAVDESISNITSCHNHLVEWSSKAGLLLNKNKCKSLTIKKKGGCIVPIVPSVLIVKKLKILGVTFNSEWTWKDHFDNITSVVSRRLYVIRVLKVSLSRKHLIDTYTSFVRSVLEYCAPLFLSMSARDSCRLERLQKRFHRTICGLDCECDSFPLLHERRFYVIYEIF